MTYENMTKTYYNQKGQLSSFETQADGSLLIHGVVIMAAGTWTDMHGITTAGSHVTWQRLTSRLCIFGKPSQEVPASVLQLRDKPTYVYFTENAAADIKPDDLFQY